MTESRWTIDEDNYERLAWGDWWLPSGTIQRFTSDLDPAIERAPVAEQKASYKALVQCVRDADTLARVKTAFNQHRVYAVTGDKKNAIAQWDELVALIGGTFGGEGQ